MKNNSNSGDGNKINQTGTNKATTLPLVIEGVSYEWPDQYITGTDVKKLAKLPTTAELFLSVPEPGNDEPIFNDTQINLARPEIEHFYVKQNLDYIVDGKKFQSDRQWIQGRTIRKKGNIPDNFGIYLTVEGPWKDEEIDDEKWVNLARPGEEHFVSKKRQVIIIVDGTPKEWDKRKITFEEVIILAFGEYIDKPTMVYTVKYEDGPKQNPEGSMVKGSVVFVKNKMIFHATATDKS